MKAKLLKIHKKLEQNHYSVTTNGWMDGWTLRQTDLLLILGGFCWVGGLKQITGKNVK